MFQISKIIPHCYSTVSNMRQYEQQWQNEILLFYCVFFFPLPQISLSLSTLSYFFSLCHSLCLPSPPCSRKLLKITLKKVAADLTASLSSPRHRSHQSSLLISPPHSPQLVADLTTSCSDFGWFGGFWVCDWVLIWVKVIGGESGDFNGLGWSCGLWLRWVDSSDLGWGYGLWPDHGSCLRLGPSTQSYFFSLCHSLSLPSPLCSRKLLKITLKKVAVNLATSLSSPHCRSCKSSPPISPPHAPVLVDLVGFGFVIGFWFGLRLWVVSQVTSMVGLKLWVVASMGWFRWFRLRLWVAIGSWIVSEIGFWFGLRF